MYQPPTVTMMVAMKVMPYVGSEQVQQMGERAVGGQPPHPHCAVAAAADDHTAAVS